MFRPMLLLLPFTGLGLGVSPPNSEPLRFAPIGLGEPRELKDDRLAPFMAFWSSGLLGDTRPPKFTLFPLIGLSRLETGEVEKLRRLAAEPTDGVREKRGGVLYADPGVGGLDDGGRPSSRRCPGVKGISDRSSFGPSKGSRLMAMLNRRAKQTPKYRRPVL